MAGSNDWTYRQDAADASDSTSDSVVSVTLDADSHTFVTGSIRSGKRTTPKQEIEELRALAASLEKKAHELKRRRKNTNVSEDTPFWKRVAHRAANEKGEAHQENLRLRALVGKHKCTIEGITKSIEDVAQLSVRRYGVLVLMFGANWLVQSEVNSCSARRWECHRPLGGDKLYEPVFATVAAAYAELDTIAHNSRCETPVSWKGSRQIQIEMQQKDGVQSTSIRLEEARLAPYPWSVTTAQIWDFLCRFNEEKIRRGLYRVRQLMRSLSKLKPGCNSDCGVSLGISNSTPIARVSTENARSIEA